MLARSVIGERRIRIDLTSTISLFQCAASFRGEALRIVKLQRAWMFIQKGLNDIVPIPTKGRICLWQREQLLQIWDFSIQLTIAPIYLQSFGGINLMLSIMMNKAANQAESTMEVLHSSLVWTATIIFDVQLSMQELLIQDG